MKNKQYLLIVGQFGLAIAILLDRFIKDSAAVSFFIGLLTGMSLVCNLAYLILYRKERSI